MEINSALIAPIIAALLCGLVTIAVPYALPQARWLFVVLKGSTTGLILVVALIPGMRGWSLYGATIVLGLLFCLLGDILLALPHERFLAGLASFMVANLIYAFAFAAPSRTSASGWATLPLAAYGAFMLWYLWPGLSGGMRAPVSAYLLIMLVMVGLAVYRTGFQTSFGTRSAAAGALLFMVSDSVLAVSRFRQPFRLVRACVLSTYFVGQLLIAISASS